MKVFWGLLLTLFLFGLMPSHAIAAERIPLTLSLLQERLNAPILKEGIASIDLQDFIIDLTNNNIEFRDQFYQQLQAKINRAKQPLGLDLSHSLIRGEFIASKLGLQTLLSQAALPPLLTVSEEEQLKQDIQFLSPTEDLTNAVTIIRSYLQLNDVYFLDKADFNRTFFLQRIEALRANFNKEVDFSEARFSRTVNFSKAVFKGDIDFSESRFWEVAKFKNIHCQGLVKFSKTLFQDHAIFTQSNFDKFADFTNNRWFKEVDFNQTNWRDRVLFSKSSFLKSLSFINATFEKSVAFRTTSFSQLIDFQDVKILGQVDFSNALFFPSATLNVAGLAFDSDQSKILGDTNKIGQVIALAKLQGNETVIRNLIRNFRNLEQIPDANQIEYKAQKLKLQQLGDRLLYISFNFLFILNWLGNLIHWLFLSSLLQMSNYGTNVNLVLGIGLITIAYFGIIFWFVDRFRRRNPTPIIPNTYDIIWTVSSFLVLTIIGFVNIFEASETPAIALMVLGLILFPIPLGLVTVLYHQGRYHDLMDISYFVSDGSTRQFRLLILRFPVIPEFPFFRDRYTYLVWTRRWNWLNYYDFSCNNLIKLGFNDIRLRDQYLPSLILTLAWYQWGLGLLYVALLLWTLSRTIPGLNLLIYLK